MPTSTTASRNPAATRLARARRGTAPVTLLMDGRITSIGTTARSWTTSIPIMTRLASVAVVPSAASVLSTTIVLESEIIAPNQIASVVGHVQRGPGQQGAEARRQPDLDRRPHQSDPPDGAQVAKREFESQGEQEERDADFGKQFDVIDVRDHRTGGIRPDHDTGGDVADQQRKAQDTRENGPAKTGDDDENEVGRDTHGSPSRRHYGSDRCATSILVQIGQSGQEKIVSYRKV